MRFFNKEFKISKTLAFEVLQTLKANSLYNFDLFSHSTNNEAKFVSKLSPVDMPTVVHIVTFSQTETLCWRCWPHFSGQRQRNESHRLTIAFEQVAGLRL